VDVLALGPEQDQYLGGLRPGAAEPVRGAVSNSAASPGFMTKSCSPSRSRAGGRRVALDAVIVAPRMAARAGLLARSA